MKPQRNDVNPNSIENRLMRIETRVCLIMEALGLDPSNTTHSESRRHYPQGAQPEFQQGAPRGDQGGAQATDRRSSFVHKFLSEIRRA